jgi:hypothetical protein
MIIEICAKLSIELVTASRNGASKSAVKLLAPTGLPFQLEHLHSTANDGDVLMFK